MMPQLLKRLDRAIRQAEAREARLKAVLGRRRD